MPFHTLSALRGALPSMALVMTTLLATPTPAQEPALGVSDPVVSWGLSGLADWETALPFIDIARTMRPIFGFTSGEWESVDHATLKADGHLDADGYPVRLPDGLAGFRTIWAWSENFGNEDRAGIYILTYQGRGTLSLGGAASVLNSSPGSIIFENPTGGAFWLDITAFDPGNRVRRISVVRADQVALAETGAMFRPGWLALIKDARELRFMDWMKTNNSSISSWSDRPRPEEASWTDRGAPLEVMVRLANETGTDPWFTIPHKADDDYIRQFATYVRDSLDPRLKAHVEYSNETWNGSFEQFYWLLDQAVAAWGSDIAEDWEAIFSYHTLRASNVAQIWEDVFGPEASNRLVNILGIHTVNVWLAERQITAPGWQRYEPDTFVEPTTVFEELAATTYFGGAFVADPVLRAEMINRFRTEGDRAYSWVFEHVLQDGLLEASIAEQKALAKGYGLKLTAYEGGQHMHHSFAVDGLSDAEADEISQYLGGFVRSPEMGALYAQLWEDWREIGDGPFMQFGEMGAPSRWGSWGILTHSGDKTPRASFVLSRQADGGSWWGEGGGPQYQQGLTAIGTEGNDEMAGTPEEDFLVGLGGDDTFLASGGNDGLNGGEGFDIYVLPDGPDGYTIAKEGNGYRVTGSLGSDFLVNIEQISFGDGTTRALD